MINNVFHITKYVWVGHLGHDRPTLYPSDRRSISQLDRRRLSVRTCDDRTSGDGRDGQTETGASLAEADLGLGI